MPPPSQVYRSDGTFLWTGGLVTVAPGQVLVDDAPLPISQSSAYCGFEVSGVARLYRAAAEITVSGVGAIGVYPAQ